MVKRATLLSVVSAIALALTSAAVSARPYGYGGYHHGYYGHSVTGSYQGPNRSQMVRTPGN
jgi:hypothetical protein